MRSRPLLASGRPGTTWRLALAVAFPWLATAAAGLFHASASAAAAAFVYLFAVVAATLVAGLPGGLLASLLSSIGLNFFFIEPDGAFATPGPADALALAAFLAFSLLVATLVGRALQERSRAEQEEREVRALYRTATRLLEGASLDVALEHFAEDLVELLGARRCEVEIRDAEGGSRRLVATAAAARPHAPGTSASARVREVPLVTPRGEWGALRIEMPEGVSLSGAEEQLEAFTGQAALAVEAALLAESSRISQLDAERSRVRAALLSSVSHDLRTPLATIRAAATALLEPGISFDNHQRAVLLSTIAEESERLNRLLANVLSLSRVRAGGLDLHRAPASIDDVIGVAVARARRSTGLPVHVRTAAALPLVAVDPVLIDQVLTNLLENALKYGQGPPPVEVQAAAHGGGVTVSVADSGPGIAEADREAVFEEFYCRPVGGQPPGAGLGLAIARAGVIAHGGTIWIDETAGGGTTVRFTLPDGGREP